MSSTLQSQSSVRVVRSEVSTDGTSSFTSDTSRPVNQPFGPNGPGFANFDVRPAVPVNNLIAVPEPSALPKCPPGGAIFCMSEYPPNFDAPMHRTHTLDYAIVMSGEIYTTLDNGEEKLLKAGDLFVQGGANHGWSNRSSEVCRIVFVMLGAEKMVLEDGRKLEETAFKK